MKNRRCWSPWLRLALVAAAGISAACSSDNSPSQPSGAPTFTAPIALEPGQTVGAATYAEGDSSTGGQGSTIQGVACDTSTPVQHIHAHLTLIADSVQRAIPRAIGAVGTFEVQDFVVAAQCFYWLHTHDATGIIHVESPVTQTFTLGQFFAIWGRPLSRTNIAGFTGTVTVYVDSTRYDGDLASLPIAAHQQITLIVGGVPKVLPLYAFPSGY